MPAARAVTLLDVARTAGVSRTTASAALSQTGRVSEETRQHVRRTAERLGYTPNLLARNLRQRRVMSIGLYIPDYVFSRGYYMDFAFGAAESAHGRQISLVLLAQGFDASDPSAQFLDGLVLVDPLDDDQIGRRLLTGSTPTVTGEFGPPDLPPAAGVVVTDHRVAMRSLLDHLAGQGARRPALLAPGTNSHWGRAVRAAYTEWCAGRATPTIIEVPFDSTPDDVRRATETLLDGPHPPDAIISAPDGAAVGAVAAGLHRGLRIGRDLLVASYVDGPVMQTSTPPITAVDLKPRSLGGACADMLIDILQAPDPGHPRVRELTTELHVRDSTIGATAGS